MRKLNVKWDSKPPPTKTPYNNSRWKKLSIEMRLEQSQCAVCSALAYDKSQFDVDHIIPVSDGGAMYDKRNLQVLCHSCHSKKTAKRGRQYEGRVFIKPNGEKIPTGRG